jgi:23S rRNA pseudouridine955/2504/2580 synthase
MCDTVFPALPLKPTLSSGPAAVQHLRVDEDSDGQRLDNFLFRLLKGVPKTHVYRIIRSGEVRRNKGRIDADDRVQAGDVLRIPPIRLSERMARRASMPMVSEVTHQSCHCSAQMRGKNGGQ